MSKKEFFPPRPLFEAGFSGLKDEQDLEIGNDEENLENP